MFFSRKINLYWGFSRGIFFRRISTLESRLSRFSSFVIAPGSEVDRITCVIMRATCIHARILLRHFEDHASRRCKEMPTCCVTCNLKKTRWSDERKDDTGIFDLDTHACMLSHACFLSKEIFDEFSMFLIQRTIAKLLRFDI